MILVALACWIVQASRSGAARRCNINGTEHLFIYRLRHAQFCRGRAMTEKQWLTANDPTPMLEFLRGKVSDRKLALFAVACSYRVREISPGTPFRTAVEVAERYVEGRATEEEMRTAWNAAHPYRSLPDGNAELAAYQGCERVTVARTWFSWRPTPPPLPCEPPGGFGEGQSELLNRNSSAKSSATPFAPFVPTPPGLPPPSAISQTASTTRKPSTVYRSWPMRCKTPGVTMPRCWTTVAATGHTFAGAS